MFSYDTSVPIIELFQYKLVFLSLSRGSLLGISLSWTLPAFALCGSLFVSLSTQEVMQVTFPGYLRASARLGSRWCLPSGSCAGHSCAQGLTPPAALIGYIKCVLLLVGGLSLGLSVLVMTYKFVLQFCLHIFSCRFSFILFLLCQHIGFPLLYHSFLPLTLFLFPSFPPVKIILFHVSNSDRLVWSISLWFWYAFSWRLVMLSVFSSLLAIYMPS